MRKNPNSKRTRLLVGDEHRTALMITGAVTSAVLGFHHLQFRVRIVIYFT